MYVAPNCRQWFVRKYSAQSEMRVQQTFGVLIQLKVQDAVRYLPGVNRRQHADAIDHVIRFHIAATIGIYRNRRGALQI